MIVAEMLKRFARGEAQDWEFDDFLSSPNTGEMENYRHELVDLPNLYPPTEIGHYCSEAGVKRIIEIANEIEVLR